MARKALCECPDCGREVSKNADICPHCGRKLRSGRKIIGIIFIVIGVLGILDALGIRVLPVFLWIRFK